MRRAWASWDEHVQDWVLSNVFDAAYCEACEAECNIEEEDDDAEI
jgi:hypothetical protein